MRVSKEDLFLFHEGNLFFAHYTFGAHVIKNQENINGVNFVVWAPHAKVVRVVGNFNSWNGTGYEMTKITDGVWQLFIPNLSQGELYKYEIITWQGERFLKADPFAFYSEVRPRTASITYDLAGYTWHDEKWQISKKDKNIYNSPLNIYEVNFLSWRIKNGEILTYRELADTLIDYVLELGYTHIEIMPLSEHPFDRSWGYQSTGYYAITSRFGTPHDFMYFVDQAHQKGVGVILDWVPGHFCKDEHGLRLFDGTPLYEYADSRKAEHYGWGTLSFDLGKPEVVSFLISNAIFFLEMFHIDGIRVDAVASMLYLDFGRKEGEWLPNQYGGRENLEAINFLQKLNKTIFHYFPDVLMIAEDSTAWPLVTYPTYLGGLGFNFKWNMGWMNDMLRYMELDPIYRKYHHNLVTFSFFYAFSENYILPISHDELVYGKRSLLHKMPGDYWQKFANFRAFLGYMYTHPGKKMIFMGTEFAQFDEWKDQTELDWFLLNYDMHARAFFFMKELNKYYLLTKALWELDHLSESFQWIDPNNVEQSIIIFLRKGKVITDYRIIIVNFTPVYYEKFRIGVPENISYREDFNSDLEVYGGSGQNNSDQIPTDSLPWHNQPFSICLRVPPLAFLILKPINKVG